MESSWTQLNRKMDEKEKSTAEHLDKMEGEINDLEQKITDKIQSEITKVEDKLTADFKHQLDKVEDNMELMLDENVKKINKDMTKMSDAFVKKEDIDSTLKNLATKIEESSTNPKNATPVDADPISPNTRWKKTAEKVSSKMKDRQERRNNFIIFKVKEQETNVTSERDRLDADIVLDLGKNCLGVNIEKSDIIRNTRIGKKTNDKNRPILVKVKDSSLKDSIFVNLNKLATSEKYKSFSFNHDMTQLERDTQKALIEEAKQKEANDVGKHRYRVRGPPWAMFIAELPPAPEVIEEVAE